MVFISFSLLILLFYGKKTHIFQLVVLPPKIYGKTARKLRYQIANSNERALGFEIKGNFFFDRIGKKFIPVHSLGEIRCMCQSMCIDLLIDLVIVVLSIPQLSGLIAGCPLATYSP